MTNVLINGMTAWKEELRFRLELQSRQIEEVLARHQISAVVIGGKIYRRTYNFIVETITRRISDKLIGLQRDLAQEMGVSEVKIVCQEDRMIIRVAHWHSHPLNLLELIESVGQVRPLTTILGADKDGRPLMLHLPSTDISNILIVGQKGAGKTSLLRAMLYSLALKNKQHQFQALVIDYDRSHTKKSPYAGPLAAFSHLPHLIEPVAATFNRAIEVLDFLINEMNYRLSQEIGYPRILMVIDNLDALLAAGQEMLLKRLLSLLQFGSDVGIHLVLSLENPTGPFTNQLLKGELPVRFIGRVVNEKIARAGAGIFETGAEYLYGKGDFIGINGNHRIRFQSAYISDYDLYLAVERFGQQKRKKLVASSAVFRPSLAQISPQ